MTDDGLIDALRRRVSLDPRKAIGTLSDPRAFPPASAADIAFGEERLGLRLPSLLRRIYAEVADGGFGPGYGVFPIFRGSDESGLDENLADVRTKLALDPRLLPLCDWGGAIWSCLDCGTEGGPIVTCAGEHPLTDTGRDLRSWLLAWLDGVDLWEEMFEPGPTFTGVNPFTKKPHVVQGQGMPRGRTWP